MRKKFKNKYRDSFYILNWITGNTNFTDNKTISIYENASCLVKKTDILNN